MTANTERLSSFSCWTALITPFLQNGEIDYASLEKLLKMQDEAQNGILLLGSTGESMSLSLEERKEVLNFALRQNLKSPLMAGVGGINLKEMEVWVNYLNTLDLDAYLMVTPLYSKPGAKGQEHWFRTLLGSASKPCMLYNIPGRSGISLNFQTVFNIRDQKNFWAIKEASGRVDDFTKYRDSAPHIKIYSGDDGMLPQFIPSGCYGVVSVASNVWPKETHQYAKKSLNGDFKDFYPVWTKAPSELFSASNPIPVKSLMAQLGIISSPILRAPLTHEDLPSMEPVMKAHEMIKQWGKQNEC